MAMEVLGSFETSKTTHPETLPYAPQTLILSIFVAITLNPDLFASKAFKTLPEARPISHLTSPEGIFFGVKRPERETDHSPLFCAEVINY
jgi:hypothetical protein